uniref:Vacuolar protein-sorting-associated protein 25 n=1 Tax=Gadus morhua TaxID=8049 RepID=A0A8C4ZWT2_GADMO
MSFEWPWQYNFPPFFTLQPNVDTRQKQLAAWCSLALAYCRHHKLYTLDVMESQESPVFNNKKIERKLSTEAIQVVFEELRKKGNLDWLDKNKSRCLVMWRRPEEWGKLIYQWNSTVLRSGYCCVPCTAPSDGRQGGAHHHGRQQGCQVLLREPPPPPPHPPTPSRHHKLCPLSLCFKTLRRLSHLRVMQDPPKIPPNKWMLV